MPAGKIWPIMSDAIDNARIGLGNTYQDALQRHLHGVWRAGDADLLAEATRRFVEGEQANAAFHEGYKAGYQAALKGVVVDQQIRRTMFQCTYEELVTEVKRRDMVAHYLAPGSQPK